MMTGVPVKSYGVWIMLRGKVGLSRPERTYTGVDMRSVEITLMGFSKTVRWFPQR